LFNFSNQIEIIPKSTLDLRGRVGYCPQQPWLINDTVKNNIILNQPYDEAKFQKVVEASALGPDLLILAKGADTMVSEGGSSLSGQCARVQFARLLYVADKSTLRS
jgi:ABC-type multidrug transport system fused ATPase/permease subunit